MSVNLPGVDTVTCTEAVGRLLWCGHDDGSVSIREPQENGVIEMRQYRSGVRVHIPTAMLWVGGEDEAQVVETVWIGWDDGRITVIDSLEFTTIGSGNVHSSMINMLTQHQQWVFSCSSDTFIHGYDASNPKPIKKITYTGHTGPVQCLACTGEVLLSCSEDNTCKVWSCKTGSEVMNLSFPVSKNEEREEIMERLHNLSEQVASLNLRDESKHYQHLLPDHLIVQTDRTERIREIKARKQDRQMAMDSQKRRLHHKPPLPTSRTPIKSSSPKKRDRSVSSEVPEPRDDPPMEYQVKSPPLGIATTATPPTVVPPSSFLSSPPPVANSPPMPSGYPHSSYSYQSHIHSSVPQHPHPQPQPGYSMKLNIDPNSGGPVVVSLDDQNQPQQQPTFQIAERPVKRGSCTAWRLQFRTEIRMLRNFYLSWYLLVVAHKRTDREILAEHMKNVSDAGVIVRYLKKWLERVALGRSPARRSISPAPVPPRATSPVTQKVKPSLSDVVLPDIPPGEQPPVLTVIADSSCLLSSSPFSSESLKAFLRTCKEYNFEVIVFLESVDHHHISVLRAADEHQAVTHCVNALLKMSNISNRNPDSTLLIIPSPPSPSTYGNTVVAPVSDRSSLDKLTQVIAKIATGGFHSVASALPVILQQEPQPAMILP